MGQHPSPGVMSCLPLAGESPFSLSLSLSLSVILRRYLDLAFYKRRRYFSEFGYGTRMRGEGRVLWRPERNKSIALFVFSNAPGRIVRTGNILYSFIASS